MNCIFCKIVSGEFPSNIVFESKNHLAFTPLKPMAPVHIICIPKKHVEKKDSIAGREKIWNDLFGFSYGIIKKFDLDKTGYKVVNNGAGYHGVNHEHIHILGGKDWKPQDGL